MGTFEQNWVLDCVCDNCNSYFADNLELALGRDSREALLRLELGLKPATGATALLNRRVKTTLQDPGAFGGIRMRMMPSEDGTAVVPAPTPQVGFRTSGYEWQFLTENELTPTNLLQFQDAAAEIRIFGVGPDCERLRLRLREFGVDFHEQHRTHDQSITEHSTVTVVYDIAVDETIIRAACKIGFNYAAKVLGGSIVRRNAFDRARRFVRYGEAPVRVATARQQSILVGPGAKSARVHACGVGWDGSHLVAVVSLFNEVTYALRLCPAQRGEFPTVRHFFDPLTRKISEAPVEV